MFSPESTSPLVKDVFGDIPEFKAPIKAVGKEAKKLKNEVA
jgi:methyl-coenzyme M reductase beta subunit